MHWSIRENYRYWYLSFDVDTERFGEIMPPPQNYLDGFLIEFKGLLALVVCGQDEDDGKCFIWVMREYGVQWRLQEIFSGCSLQNLNITTSLKKINYMKFYKILLQVFEYNITKKTNT